MTTTLIIIGSVYTGGVLAVVVIGCTEWSIARSLGRMAQAVLDDRNVSPHMRDWYEDRLTEHQTAARTAARKVIHAPAWPFAMLHQASDLIRDARTPPTEGPTT
jgi:hypothetical protein